MELTTTDQSARIKRLVCDILELSEDEVTDTSRFAEDHGADSLRAIEILAALEKEFRIVIDQEEMANMVNLRGVEDVVVRALRT
ncbi:acyl carrier protein [Goodfellowiella coeruleoviolacea]|uniref:Acyl carrier protein n=1 Tax=Goodfellowiella coeruleoviolacea TaxID=334858 RepID=A0AAE3KI54_9PSEU|nr:acyl carrier protein [Goodfellowiella coeruleoviolacea]MCP2167074.1 acyl carrier protein [Goodfellowiella coeruleoviolacea]